MLIFLKRKILRMRFQILSNYVKMLCNHTNVKITNHRYNIFEGGIPAGAKCVTVSRYYHKYIHENTDKGVRYFTKSNRNV